MYSIQSQLLMNLQMKQYILKTVIWHGLSIDQPFIAQNIIMAAFANTERARYPDFDAILGKNFVFCNLTSSNYLI